MTNYKKLPMVAREVLNLFDDYQKPLSMALARLATQSNSVSPSSSVLRTPLIVPHPSFTLTLGWMFIMGTALSCVTLPSLSLSLLVFAGRS